MQLGNNLVVENTLILKKEDAMNQKWVELTKINGPGIADIFKGFLEANEIEVWLNREGVGEAMGLIVGRMGETTILVPENQLEAAQELADEFFSEDEAMQGNDSPIVE